MGLFSALFGPKKPRVLPVHVDDESFGREVARSELPVVLDVWSPGCAPCRSLEPIVLELASRYEGRIKVAELDASASPATAARLGVRGTPTVLFFKQGREVERVVGFVGELYLREIVDAELLDPPSA